MKFLVLFVSFYGVISADIDKIKGNADALINYGDVNLREDLKDVQQYGGYGEDKYSYNDRYNEGEKYDQLMYRNSNDRNKYDKYEAPQEFLLSPNNNNKENGRFDAVNKCDDLKNCKDNSDRIKDENQYDDNKRDYYGQNWDNDKDFYNNVNIVGLGRNDTEDIVRPCALDDWQCIRKYFAANSKCKPAYGPIPDPLYIKRATVYFPNVNLTIIPTRLRVTGLGRLRISEFYVNQNTGNLVLALDFQNLNLSTPRAFFRYKRTAKESIVLDDFATVNVRSGTFTAVIPKIPHLRLELAEIHADIDDSLPPFAVGPGVVNNDPDVVSAFSLFVIQLPITVQEAALFLVQLFTSIYIQENICDFGLKIISV